MIVFSPVRNTTCVELPFLDDKKNQQLTFKLHLKITTSTRENVAESKDQYLSKILK